MKGKIICINKSIHRVLTENNEIIDCETRGKLRNNKITPLVGDNVIIDVDKKRIEEVLERKNSLLRPLISNIDTLLIVMSVTIPSFSSYLIDKFLIIAFANNIEPIIVITKMDKLKYKDKLNIKKYIKYYRKIGIKTYYNKSIRSIKRELTNKVVSLCGQTGAGKSTLLNKIDKSLSLKTDEVSTALGRGKHTTRLVEIFKLNKFMVADTPGFSSLDLNIKKEEIKKCYPDFNKECKYKTCTHNKEDGCAIKELVEKNIIPKWRYNNYIKLMEEAK